MTETAMNTHLIWVRPEQITDQSMVRYVQRSVYVTQLVDGGEVRGQSTMHA